MELLFISVMSQPRTKCGARKGVRKKVWKPHTHTHPRTPTHAHTQRENWAKANMSWHEKTEKIHGADLLGRMLLSEQIKMGDKLIKVGRLKSISFLWNYMSLLELAAAEILLFWLIFSLYSLSSLTSDCCVILSFLTTGIQVFASRVLLVVLGVARCTLVLVSGPVWTQGAISWRMGTVLLSQSIPREQGKERGRWCRVGSHALSGDLGCMCYCKEHRLSPVSSTSSPHPASLHPILSPELLQAK